MIKLPTFGALCINISYLCFLQIKIFKISSHQSSMTISIWNN